MIDKKNQLLNHKKFNLINGSSFFFHCSKNVQIEEILDLFFILKIDRKIFTYQLKINICLIEKMFIFP